MLPGGTEFRSRRLPVDPARMLALSEENLPRLNALPDREERRLRGKCRVRFRLLPGEPD